MTAGIGTYVASGSLTHNSTRARLKSWYTKAKDSAIGSSFDHHVVGGYRFLMRFYCPGDEIYLFGYVVAKFSPILPHSYPSSLTPQLFSVSTTISIALGGPNLFPNLVSPEVHILPEKSQASL